MGVNPILCIFNQGFWLIHEYYNLEFFWFCYRLFWSACDTKIKILATHQSQKHKQKRGS